MNYLNNNLECLKCKSKKMYEKITHIIEQKEYSFDRFKINYAKNGQKIVEIKNEEQYIRLNSIYNPKSEAQHWVKKLNFKNLDAPVLMFGLVDGIFATEILKYLSKDSRALFVEPDVSLFIFCLNEFDMESILLDSRVIIFVDGINLDVFDNVIDARITDKMLYTQIICSYPKMDYIYYKVAGEFTDSIRKKIKMSNSNLAIYYRIAKDTMKNTFLNMHYIKDSNYISDFIGKIPKDIPFIIVAAGPSLDKNIAELKRAEGRAFIIATDRAVRSLVKHNINFDAMLTLDSLKDKSDVGISPELYSKYPLFCGLDSSNELMNLSKGHKILQNTTSFLINLYAKYNIRTESYSEGGSVATRAFNIGRILGMKRIVLIGQDLAYLGDVSHADGVAEDTSYLKCEEKVEGIYGEKVRTRLDWLRYLRWYERAIKELPDDIEVIDATEGGAKIEGTIIMKLSEVIDKYCTKEFDFKNFLENTEPTFVKDKYSEIQEDLFHLKDELILIRECAENGVEAADSLLELDDIDDYSKYSSYSKKIKELNDIIEEQLLYSIIITYIEKDINLSMRNINIIKEDKKENLKVTCEITKNVYEVILRSLEEIEPLLDAALKEI